MRKWTWGRFIRHVFSCYLFQIADQSEKPSRNAVLRRSRFRLIQNDIPSANSFDICRLKNIENDCRKNKIILAPKISIVRISLAAQTLFTKFVLKLRLVEETAEMSVQIFDECIALARRRERL